MLDVNFFDELRIGLATADDIRAWSHGEVKKPETINYRTLKPEKDGLFCEKIFGPTRDWECACGKYKRVRFKGIICERCGVEVTRAKVRRERMGHIELAAPVTHIWYFKGVPSRLGYLLDLAPKDLEKIIYFAAYLITSVDDTARHNDLPTIEAEMSVERKNLENARDADIDARAKKLEGDLAELEAEGAKSDVRRKVREGGEREQRQIRDRAQRQIDRLDEVLDTFRKLKVRDLIIDEVLYRELEDRFGDYFHGGMGAEALKQIISDFDIDRETEILRDTIKNGKGQRKIRAIKRLKVVAAFQQTSNSPLGMVLDCVPVIPPELRPMVQLDGGRFATSDLNDLYRRVINRNNRLKRLIDLGAPEIIVNNEKRMLQEAVDALFDNGRRGRPVTGPGNRPLKSLSDLLKGKQGRFRQNLLGKRVDYSGRSVIVVGPQLKLHQCGLPKLMALELFKPFVMKRLVDLNHAQNIKSAKRMVERQRSQVWDVLEEVISAHPVLLNRAPTLHRLGIQAFEPQLVEGKAIQLHPLVCAAFNADFDGDQMAVHVPLSAEAQAEARVLMLSSNNILSPGSGRPLAMPSLDLVTGLYYLCGLNEDGKGAGSVFSSAAEAIMALDAKLIDVRSPIRVRLPGSVVPGPKEQLPEDHEPGTPWIADTTLGRVLFNELLPTGYPFVNDELPKKRQALIVNDLAEHYPMSVVAQTLDRLKEAGFHWATRSGMTVAIGDVIIPPEKEEILLRHEIEAERVEKAYQRGNLSHAERNDDLVKIWEAATKEIEEAIPAAYPKDNPVYILVAAGAAGNWIQVRSLAGMKGVVANSKGQQIPRPIRSSFREGLSVLEYFINTHSARKGLADTALRTAESGYLTRRLVDVSQDVIVRESDCGTERGVDLPMADRYADGSLHINEFIETSVQGRVLAVDLVAADGTVVVPRGTDMREQHVKEADRRRHHQRQGAFGADLRGRHRYLRDLLRPFVGHRQPRRCRRGGRYRRRAVHRRARYPADHADLPHRCGLGVFGHHPGSAPCAGAVRGPDPEGQGAHRRCRRTDPDRGLGQVLQDHHRAGRRLGGDRVRQAAQDAAARHDHRRRFGASAGRRRHRPGRSAAAGRQPGSARGAARDGPPPGAAAPGPRGAERVPLAGCVHPRQAHRGDHPADAAPGDHHRLRLDRVPAGCGDRAQGVRGVQPPGARRGWGAGRRSSRADGHHQGVAGHRVVALGRLLPGDDPGAHRRGDQRQERSPGRAQGERHHRQADPRRDRHRAVPRHRGAADRGGKGRGLHAAHLRRHLLRRRHLRGLRRGVGAAG